MEHNSEADIPVLSNGEISITAISPINIALIKYWGKVNEELIIPLNSSLSITLSADDLRSKTTVTLSKNFTSNALVLNEKEEAFTTRINNVLERIHAIVPEAGVQVKDQETGEMTQVSKQELMDMKIKVVSENNFPTASGVASSSSGLSCLAFCLAKVYGCDIDLTEISRLARLGSGSACRSLFGGFVMWDRGFEDSRPFFEQGSQLDLNQIDKDSRAVQVQPETHWSDICCCILVADSKQKKVSSTKGMKTSVDTSEFLKYREREIVPKHLEQIKTALADKDWGTFCEIIMKESNSLHSVCLDTYPPIFYQNDTTKNIISMIHDLNSMFYEPVAAYTVDAGANCFVITKQAHLEFLLDCVKEVSAVENISYSFASEVQTEHNQIDSAQLNEVLSQYKEKINLHQVIVTRVGKGVEFVKE